MCSLDGLSVISASPVAAVVTITVGPARPRFMEWAPLEGLASMIEGTAFACGQTIVTELRLVVLDVLLIGLDVGA